MRPVRFVRQSSHSEEVSIPVVVTKKVAGKSTGTRAQVAQRPRDQRHKPSHETISPIKVASPKARAVVAPAMDLDDNLLSSLTMTVHDSGRKPVRPGWVSRIQKKQVKQRAKLKSYSKKQAISDHLDELRRRLLYCVLALVVGGVAGYQYQTEIIKWLVKPLGQQLFYTSPTGGFDFLIKICLFFGFLLAVPVIIYNIIQFLAPAVPRRVSYSVSRLLFVSIVLALSGVLFAYYVSLPAALHFLNNFTNAQISSLISAQEYFNFVMIYLAGFAALFQMPLLFSFINKITPLKPALLVQKQRIVVLVSFIVAAVLTPTPDPMNQTIMAMPIIGLYQVSVGVVWRSNRHQRRKKEYIAP
jgi:sec-independent protein translocase protein TatC